MEDQRTNYREVNFEKYCHECKYEKREGFKDPCDECLTFPINFCTDKPINFREKEN